MRLHGVELEAAISQNCHMVAQNSGVETSSVCSDILRSSCQLFGRGISASKKRRGCSPECLQSAPLGRPLPVCGDLARAAHERLCGLQLATVPRNIAEGASITLSRILRYTPIILRYRRFKLGTMQPQSAPGSPDVEISDRSTSPFDSRTVEKLLNNSTSQVQHAIIVEISNVK